MKEKIKKYQEIKNQYKNTIVLFQEGDFYKVFCEDAKLISKLLNLVLTSSLDGIPLAGFSYHFLDNYLPKLVKMGYRVAICEQLEDPALVKDREVRRDVVEVVTPGVY